MFNYCTKPGFMIEPRFFGGSLLLLTLALSTLAYGQTVLTTTSQRKLHGTVQQFADSYYLGTERRQFVSNITPINDGYAVAIIGDREKNKRRDNAFTVHVRRLKGEWKIVGYEFEETRAGKKQGREWRDIYPPFPDSFWEKPS